jgi:hypothetical protein
MLAVVGVEVLQTLLVVLVVLVVLEAAVLVVIKQQLTVFPELVARVVVVEEVLTTLPIRALVLLDTVELVAQAQLFLN